jgi:organic radical activating enzyme
MWNCVKIVLTDTCTAECEICYAACSPKNKRVMSEKLLFDALSQIKELAQLDASKQPKMTDDPKKQDKLKGKGMKIISFTGGEPFLFYDLLKAGVMRAKELGFSVEVRTNGFWGAWPSEQISQKLDDLPLDYMIISTDYHHSRFVPESSLEGAMSYVKGRNLRCTLRVGETRSAPADEYIVRMGPYKYMTNIVIHPFMRMGRAKPMDEENFFRVTRAKGEKCPSDKTISIRYDGEVFLGGGPSWTDDALSFGNMSKRPLSEMLTSERAKGFFDAFELGYRQNG